MRNENDDYHSPINQSPMLSIKLSGLLCSYIYFKKPLRSKYRKSNSYTQWSRPWFTVTYMYYTYIRTYIRI